MDARGEILEKIHGGLIGRIAGSTLGLPVEGRSHEQVKSTYGYLEHYEGIKLVDGKFPGTINDDEMYEIILLLALERHGHAITTRDIANEWLERLEGFQFVFTAEKVALERFRKGIFVFGDDLVEGNPFHDYIGAQMRGELPGWVHPGRPDRARELAVTDAAVSHAGDGVTGEAFIASMVAGAFDIPPGACKDGRVDRDALLDLVDRSEACIPRGSRYHRVVRLVHELHDQHPDDWERAFLAFRDHVEGDMFDELLDGAGDARRAELLKSYHVHVLPNAGIVLLALLHGGGSFTDTLAICAGCGMDTDCNCGNAGGILGTALGASGIPSRWAGPLDNTFLTIVKGWEEDRIDAIAARIGAVARDLAGG